MNRLRPHHALAASVLIVLGATASTHASPRQVAAASPELVDMRRPVDQGLADRNVLGTSLRRLPPELGYGRSFDRLYVDPQDPDQFMRVQGGLSIVFPSSVYVPTKRGVAVAVPPSAVFRIGSARASLADAAAPPTGPIDLRAEVDGSPGTAKPIDAALDLRVGERAWIPAPLRTLEPEGEEPRFGYGVPAAVFVVGPRESAERGPLFMVDEEYRRRRLAALLLGAAGAP